MKVIILSGAGLSAESGINTFRGKNGLWNDYPIKDIATNDGFTKYPKLVHNFYNILRNDLKNIKPNSAHFAISILEKDPDFDVLHITQNIDDLSEQAGNKNIIHIHGELKKVRCLMCSKIVNWNKDTTINDKCPQCGFASEWGGVRPHIVWFNEMPLNLDKVNNALKECELFIAIGTSCEIFPAAGFVRQVKCKTILLNKEPVNNGYLFDEFIKGNATKIVPDFINKLLGHNVVTNNKIEEIMLMNLKENANNILKELASTNWKSLNDDILCIIKNEDMQSVKRINKYLKIYSKHIFISRLLEFAKEVAECGNINWSKDIHKIILLNFPNNTRSQVYDYCRITESIINNFNDNKWAYEVYKLSINIGNNSKDYMLIVESIIENLDDKEFANKTYTLAINRATSSYDYFCIAVSIFSKLKDRKWTVELYELAIENAKDFGDYINIANNIFNNLNEKEWANKIYKLAVEKAEYYTDYISIANKNISHLNNYEWAIENYKSAIDKAEITRHYKVIADSILNIFHDKEWAIEIYKQGIEKAINAWGWGYYCIANSIIENFHDKEWGRELYKSAIKNAAFYDDSQAIAESLIKNLDDKKWAIKVYKLAIEKARKSHSYQSIADSIIENLDDKEWGGKIYKLAIKNARESCDYQEVAESIINNLNDKKWAGEIYKQAIKNAKITDDYREIADSIIHNLQDYEWIDKIYDRYIL